jgi:hypothetical protein
VLLLLSLRGRLLGADLRLNGSLVQHLRQRDAECNAPNPFLVNARRTEGAARRAAHERTGLGAWMALSRSCGSNCFFRLSMARAAAKRCGCGADDTRVRYAPAGKGTRRGGARVTRREAYTS